MMGENDCAHLRCTRMVVRRIVEMGNEKVWGPWVFLEVELGAQMLEGGSREQSSGGGEKEKRSQVELGWNVGNI